MSTDAQTPCFLFAFRAVPKHRELVWNEESTRAYSRLAQTLLGAYRFVITAVQSDGN